MQVEKELTKYNKNIKLKSFIFQAGIDEVKNKDIIISKTPEIIDFLSKMIYSASSLSDYILCTLKFYLSRIAGLKKEESVEEAFSGAAFGNLLHAIMKQLYEQSRSSEITEKEILIVKNRIQNEFDVIWALALPDSAVLEFAGSDVVDLGRAWLVNPADWAPWTLPDGSPAWLPAYARFEAWNGGLIVRAGDGTVIGEMPAGAFYLSQKQFPLAE